MSEERDNKYSERPTNPPGRDEATIYHIDTRSEYSGDGEKYIKMTQEGLYDFGFERITEVKILDGTKYICDNAFDGCEHLQNVIIPNTVTHIGTEAFKKCGSIDSIRIPNSVKVIGFQAFTECYSLRRFESVFASDDGRCLVINNILVAIAPCGLEELYIPEGVISIGNGVFAYCPNLKRIHFPDSLVKFPLNCFNQCKSLEVLYSKYSSEDQKCIIIDGKLILCIEKKSEVYSVQEGVATIGVCAFCWNTTIREITLPSSIRSIEPAAFAGCSKLINISIPNGVKTIGYGAFANCSVLKEIIIPNSVDQLGASVFSGCKALKEVILSNRLSIIQSEAFRDCISLLYVHVPNSVITIGKSAFENCESLETIVLPNELNIIDENAFNNCESLKRLVLPSKLNTIKRMAFGRCECLKDVSFTPSLQAIEKYAFRGCKALEEVNLTICLGLKEIDEETFAGCSSMKRLNLPETITYIRKGAFRYCSLLEDITIPESVKTVEEHAFGNNGIKSVRFLSGDIKVCSHAFSFCNNLQTVIIPKGTLSYFESLFKSFSINSFTGHMTLVEVGGLMKDVITTSSKSLINKPLYRLGECNRHYSSTSERSYYIPDDGKTIRVDIDVIIISCSSCTGCVRIGNNVVYNRTGGSWLKEDSHKCPYSENVKAILKVIEEISVNEKRYELLLFALRLLYKELESKEIVIDETLKKVINYELSETVNKYWQYVGYSYGNDPPAPSSMSAPPGGTIGTTIELIEDLIAILGECL